MCFPLGEGSSLRRSAVLIGKLDQRDRAKLRGRLDRCRQGTTQEPEDELREWLRAAISVTDVSDAERLNLTDFLRGTGQIELPPEERLRQLAIHLEADMSSHQLRGWLAVDRVYQQAIRLAPKSVRVHESRAISAKYCADYYGHDEAKAIHRILAAAWEAANTANTLCSTDADVLYLLGWLCYDDPNRTVYEALSFFDESIKNNSDYQWSLLYRAHCLHDLERWADAARAYDRVSPAFFVGPSRVWRYELSLEQRAYCRLRSGDSITALAEFERLLQRWIANPKLAFSMMGVEMRRVARGEFREQLSTKFEELIQHDEWSWLLDTQPDGDHPGEATA